MATCSSLSALSPLPPLPQPARARIVVATLPLIAVAALTTSIAGAAPPTDGDVLVWRGSSAAQERAAGAVEAAVLESGRTVVPFAPTRARMEAAIDADKRRAAETQEALERDLDRARQAYLEQRFTDAIAGLVAIEARIIETHRPGGLAAALWPVEILLAVAFHARANPTDAAERTRRFEFALALAPDRSPPQDFFGPVVSRAFQAARDAWQLQPSRAIDVSVTPPSATMAVDGGPATPASSAISVRGSLHVVVVSAPGKKRVARLIDASRGGVSATLADATTDAASVALDWRAGRLSMETPSGLALLRRVMAERGAAIGVVVGATHVVVVTATEVSRTASAPSPSAAVKAALTVPRELDLGPAPPSESGRDAPIHRRWWFWAGVAGVAVVGGVALGIALSERTERLELHAPQSGAILRF